MCTYVIYKLVNDVEPNVIYIGTAKNMKRRFIRHMILARGAYTNKLYSYMRRIGLDHFKPELIHDTGLTNKAEALKIETNYMNDYKQQGYVMLNSIRSYVTEEERAQKMKENKTKLYIQNLVDPTKFKPRINTPKRDKTNNQCYQNRRNVQVTNIDTGDVTVYRSIYQTEKALKINRGLIVYAIKNGKPTHSYKIELLDNNYVLDDVCKNFLKQISVAVALSGVAKRDDPVRHKNEMIRHVRDHYYMDPDTRERLLTHLQ